MKEDKWLTVIHMVHLFGNTYLPKILFVKEKDFKKETKDLDVQMVFEGKLTNIVNSTKLV